MRPALALKQLLRSPVKNILTLLLIAASSFLLLYNMLDYAVTKREYTRIYNSYQGYVNVEDAPAEELTNQLNYATSCGTARFLLSDPAANPAWAGDLNYDDYHLRSFTGEELETLTSLPYITGIERRYMTAGVSPYPRLLTNAVGAITPFFIYNDRVVFEGLCGGSYRFGSAHATASTRDRMGNTHAVKLTDIRLLAGNEELLRRAASYRERQRMAVAYLGVYPERELGPELRISFSKIDACYYRNVIWEDELSGLEEGKRYIFVARVDPNHFEMTPSSGNTSATLGRMAEFVCLGDDSLLGWVPYVTEVEGETDAFLASDAGAALREVIDVTERDVYTLDVIYTDEMRAIRHYQDGGLTLMEGRLLTADDTAEKRPVCLVSAKFAERNFLKVGDELPLELGDKLLEQNVVLGAVAVSKARSSENWTRQTFTIVGTYAESGLERVREEDLCWRYGENAVFVPQSFLNVSEEELAKHEFKPSELSLVIRNAGSITAFYEEVLPTLWEMGYSVYFSDGGWLSVEPQLTQAGSLAGSKLIAFAAAALLSLAVTVYLFILRKKREYAVMRALGCPKRRARRALLLPLLTLAGFAILLGTGLAVLYTSFTMELNMASFHTLGITVDTSLPVGVILLGFFGCAAALLLLAAGGLILVGRRPPLTLLQEQAERPRRAPVVEEPPAETLRTDFSLLRELPPPRFRPRQAVPHSLRYLGRRLRRSRLRSALCLLLALVLCFAVGYFSVVRAEYARLVETVEVKARFINGFGVNHATRVQNSGYIRDTFLEYTTNNAESFFEPDNLCLTTDLTKSCLRPVTMLEGYDPAKVMGKTEAVCVVSRALLDKLGLELGDRIEVVRRGLLQDYITYALVPETEEEYLSRYHNAAAKLTVVGAAEDGEGSTVYAPMSMWRVFTTLFAAVYLDTAEFTLNSYAEAPEFRSYALHQLDSNGLYHPRFTMDTAEADRVYRTYRLIELLYPIAFAAAVLIGGLLPGVVVLQGAKEVSLLRVLGTTKRRVRALLLAEQLALCLAGLVLAMLLLFAVRGPSLFEVGGALRLYLAAHLGACLLVSAACAVSVSRRNVLELLQVKE